MLEASAKVEESRTIIGDELFYNERDVVHKVENKLKREARTETNPPT